MICKWCAAEISPSETVCRRCGRETTALSDCGGFYDLVPQAAPPASVVARPQPVRKKGPLGLLCLLLAVALAVSVIACVVIAGEKRELAEEIEELEELLDDSGFGSEIGKDMPQIPKPEKETPPEETGGDQTEPETLSDIEE